MKKHYSLDFNSDWMLYPTPHLNDLPNLSGTEQSNFDFLSEYYYPYQKMSFLPEIECIIRHQRYESLDLMSDEEISKIPLLDKNNLPDVVQRKSYVFPLNIVLGEIIISERFLKILKEEEYLTQNYFTNKLIVDFEGEKITYYMLYIQLYENEKPLDRIGVLSKDKILTLNKEWDFFKHYGFKVSERLRNRIVEEKLNLRISEFKPKQGLKGILLPLET